MSKKRAVQLLGCGNHGGQQDSLIGQTKLLDAPESSLPKADGSVQAQLIGKIRPNVP
ncbi:MAG TPA: hypothetical protein V6D22_03090 [Candidatus Obscuribacterales bacterium]